MIHKSGMANPHSQHARASVLGSVWGSSAYTGRDSAWEWCEWCEAREEGRPVSMSIPRGGALRGE
jgi:hypothetical protein